MCPTVVHPVRSSHKSNESDVNTYKDDDPIWEQHSGGSGHSGVEWDDGDLTLAKDLYVAFQTTPGSSLT